MACILSQKTFLQVTFEPNNTRIIKCISWRTFGLKYRVAWHVVDYLLLTAKYEILIFQLGSRAATL